MGKHHANRLPEDGRTLPRRLSSVRHDEGGYVLVWAIVAFVVLGALAAASLRSSQVQRADARATIEYNESFFAAESGLQALLADADSLTAGLAPGDSAGVAWTALPGSSRYRGWIQRVDDGSGQELYVARSIGAGAGLFAGRTELSLAFTTDGAGAWPYGVGTAENVLVSGNVKIDSYNSSLGEYHPADETHSAQVFANGNITTVGKATIGGDATAAGTASGNITGTATSGAPPQAYDPVACPPGAYSFLKVESTVTLPGGTYYADSINVRSGTIKIPSGEKVVIYNRGGLFIGSSSHVNWLDRIPSDLVIYGCGSNADPWVIAKAATHVFALLYAPGHPMQVEGGATFYGGLVAKSLTVIRLPVSSRTRRRGRAGAGPCPSDTGPGRRRSRALPVYRNQPFRHMKSRKATATAPMANNAAG